MNNIWNVFKFEFNNQLRKKSFWISNIIMALIIIFIASVPTIITNLSGDSLQNIEGNVEENSEVIENEIVANDSLNEEYPYLYVDESINSEVLSTVFPFNIMRKITSIDEIKSDISSGKIEEAIVLSSDTYKVYVKNESLYSDYSEYLDAFNEYKSKVNLIENGIDTNVLDLINRDYFSPEVISIEKSSSQNFISQNFIIGYLGVLILYMMIILYGQSTATMVATEKSNRTMEILVTSTSPKSLILGKVFAGVVLGFFQIMILIFSVVIGITINKSNYPSGLLSIIASSLTPELFLVLTLFTILGFALYLFIYAASGALVSKIEELNSVIAPVQTLVIIAFVIGISSLYGSSESNIVKIASFIPFTSPYAMFVRYSVFGVGMGELLVSITILILTIVLVAYLCIRIYRNATLNYGNKLNLFGEIKKLFKKD